MVIFRFEIELLQDLFVLLFDLYPSYISNILALDGTEEAFPEVGVSPCEDLSRDGVDPDSFPGLSGGCSQLFPKGVAAPVSEKV